jgi:hypothetical protein
LQKVRGASWNRRDCAHYRLACSLRILRTMTTYERRSPIAAIAVAAALALPLVSSCSAKRETITTRQSETYEQHAAVAPKMIDISIVNLHDEPIADPSQEKVVGTVINQGDRQVTGLSIQINALDGTGNVIRTVKTPPLPQTIAANGGRTTFEAFMPKDPAVAGYHAVAIAK